MYHFLPLFLSPSAVQNFYFIRSAQKVINVFQIIYFYLQLPNFLFKYLTCRTIYQNISYLLDPLQILAKKYTPRNLIKHRANCFVFQPTIRPVNEKKNTMFIKTTMKASR